MLHFHATHCDIHICNLCPLNWSRYRRRITVLYISYLKDTSLSTIYVFVLLCERSWIFIYCVAAAAKCYFWICSICKLFKKSMVKISQDYWQEWINRLISYRMHFEKKKTWKPILLIHSYVCYLKTITPKNTFLVINLTILYIVHTNPCSCM